MTARLFPPVVKDGVDPFMTEAAVVPYDIPNQLGSAVIHDTGLRVGYWRSVSHALNVVRERVVHGRAGAPQAKDPYQFRHALLDKQPRFTHVLELAADKAGWGKPLPAGRSRGIALMEGYGTYMAQVAEVSVANERRSRCTAWSSRSTSGRMVNPNIVRQQLESSIDLRAVGGALRRDHAEGRRVQQTNFNNYPVVRMPESPKIDMHIVASTEKPGGIGEPGTALIRPAVANAVFAATGKRLRKLPLRLA